LTTVGEGFEDIYADGFIIAGGPYGVALTLTLTDPLNPGAASRPIGRVRCSLQLGKTLAKSIATTVEQAESLPPVEAQPWTPPVSEPQEVPD
jgi:hypothetical protein